MNLTRFHLGTLARLYADGGVAHDSLEVRDYDVVEGAVSSWRYWLNKELPHALDWNESATAPFETCDVGDDSLGALVMLCVDPKSFLRAPELRRDWRNDQRYRNAIQSEFARPFDSVYRPTLWLPGNFDFVAKTRGLAEEELTLGSSQRLLDDLEQVTKIIPLDSQVGEMASDTADVLQRLTRRSVEFRLPLRRF